MRAGRSHCGPFGQFAGYTFRSAGPGQRLGSACGQSSKRPVANALQGLFYYKIGADFAAALEASGYRTAQIGVEATLDITSFSLEGSKRRELRRKIRSVEKAGVEIRKHAAGALPHERFAHVAKAWSAGAQRRTRVFDGPWLSRLSRPVRGIGGSSRQSSRLVS